MVPAGRWKDRITDRCIEIDDTNLYPSNFTGGIIIEAEYPEQLDLFDENLLTSIKGVMLSNFDIKRKQPIRGCNSAKNQ